MAIIGLWGLFVLIKDYGFHRLQSDINNIGIKDLALLFLTFIPTLICYSFSWWLVTIPMVSQSKAKSSLSSLSPLSRLLPLPFFPFLKLTVISIAWNNLTPFLKVGGEPLKAIMLRPYLQDYEQGVAVNVLSTVVYNIVHLLGTLGAFILAAAVIIFYYPVDYFIKLVAIMTIVSSVIVYFLLMCTPRWIQKILGPKSAFSRVSFIMGESAAHFSFSSVIIWSAVVVEIMARFIEGITFYLAFRLVGNRLSFLSSSLIEVGRTLVDTIFFFVPYQLGSREQGVAFLLEKVLGTSTVGFLAAVFMYRLVEIFWIAIGYSWWIWGKKKNSPKKLQSDNFQRDLI